MSVYTPKNVKFKTIGDGTDHIDTQKSLSIDSLNNESPGKTLNTIRSGGRLIHDNKKMVEDAMIALKSVKHTI